ncbi:MAG TPA: AraC family transcriptional regulator, partial [Arachidicoccus sp.]|nr:AraC family transcriptional regulator [Arachidicoccus sp.]
CVMLFQALHLAPYEIVNSDYLNGTADKITCYANSNCIEMHFVLTGKATFRLEDLDWNTIQEGHHNVLALSRVKNETYFKILPISTFDIHFTKDQLRRLCCSYPQLDPLLEALNTGKYTSLSKLPIKTTPIMFHLILQIKEIIMTGETDGKKTIQLIEHLIRLVIENKPYPSKHIFKYEEIHKIYNAHKQIPQHLDEGGIISNIIEAATIKPARFRAGFRLLYGCLPKDFLRISRLEKAMWLAMQGRSKTIRDIAQICGYDSPAQLSKAFFKHFDQKLIDVIRKQK